MLLQIQEEIWSDLGTLSLNGLKCKQLNPTKEELKKPATKKTSVPNRKEWQ